MDKLYFMQEAYKQAVLAGKKDEVPIGCVIIKDGKIIAKAHNQKQKKNNSIFHAEIEAITKATKHLSSWHLDDCEMYVTLEPCIMCTGAIINSRIKKVYFACRDYKGGGIVSNLEINKVKNLNHYIEYEEGLYENECSSLLTNFFKNKRNNKSLSN